MGKEPKMIAIGWKQEAFWRHRRLQENGSRQREGEGRYGFFLPQPLRWYSAFPVGMFYAERVKAGEIDFHHWHVFL